MTVTPILCQRRRSLVVPRSAWRLPCSHILAVLIEYEKADVIRDHSEEHLERSSTANSEVWRKSGSHGSNLPRSSFP